MATRPMCAPADPPAGNRQAERTPSRWQTSAQAVRAPSLCGKRSDFGFPLRIGQIAEFNSRSARDLGHLVARLEAGEVRPFPPSERAAELLAGLDRGVMDDVDRALVVRITLPVTGEI